MKLVYDDGSVKDLGDEPVFILRAEDALTPGVLAFYRLQCRRERLRTQDREVGKAFNEIREWQKNNKDKVKLPDHKHQPVGVRSALPPGAVVEGGDEYEARSPVPDYDSPVAAG